MRLVKRTKLVDGIRVRPRMHEYVGVILPDRIAKLDKKMNEFWDPEIMIELTGLRNVLADLKAIMGEEDWA